MVTLALVLAVVQAAAPPAPVLPAAALTVAQAPGSRERAPHAKDPAGTLPPRTALARSGSHYRRTGGSLPRPVGLGTMVVVPLPARQAGRPVFAVAVAKHPPKADPNSPRDPPAGG